MKTLVFIVLMTVVVVTLGQQRPCPDEKSEIDKENEVFQNNDATVTTLSSNDVLGALASLYTKLRPDIATTAVQRPSVSYLELLRCKAQIVTLNTIFHQGQKCYVIAPQWQNVQVARCTFEECCNDDRKGKCWPHEYKTYSIHVFCLKPKPHCRIIQRTYPTSCDCKAWKCQRG